MNKKIALKITHNYMLLVCSAGQHNGKRNGV